MTGRKTGMLRICEKRRNRWIGLVGTQFQVRVFGIPTGECGVMLRDGFICISPGGARRIGIQMVLKDFQVHLLQPRQEESWLPKRCHMIGRIASIQTLYSRVLSIGGLRSKRRRRIEPKVPAT